MASLVLVPRWACRPCRHGVLDLRQSMGVLVHGLKSHSNAWAMEPPVTPPTGPRSHVPASTTIHAWKGRLGTQPGHGPDICNAVQPSLPGSVTLVRGGCVAGANTGGRRPRSKAPSARSSDHHVVSSGDVLHPRRCQAGFPGAHLHRDRLGGGLAKLAHLARELPTSRIQVLMAIACFPS